MKFQPERLSGVNQIQSTTPETVTINGVVWRQPVVLPWVGEVAPWSVPDFQALAPDHFEALAAWAPELVIFGAGPRLRFPPPACLAPLMQRRIGFETMDTGAACRTYNVLVGEGRKVVAALLVGPPPAGRP